MTPIALEILLRAYYLGDGVSGHHVKAQSMAHEHALNGLANDGMIQMKGSTRDDIRYVTTEKGNVYVKAIMKVPHPEQVWVIPEMKTEG